MDFKISDDDVLISYIGKGGDVVIPDGVTSIGNKAFYNCESLTSIVIPDSVTRIGNEAFHECVNLSSITIPNSVTSIGHNAFYGCKKITSVTIPDSVIGIGDGVFTRTGINYPIYYKDKLIYVPSSALGEFVVKPGTVSINGAFFACRNITSIVIPDSVTRIGNEAFAWCTNLKSINIPDSVTSIYDDAFSNCKNLVFINIPNSVEGIGGYAFWECKNLTVYSLNTKWKDIEFIERFVHGGLCNQNNRFV